MHLKLATLNGIRLIHDIDDSNGVFEKCKICGLQGDMLTSHCSLEQTGPLLEILVMHGVLDYFLGEWFCDEEMLDIFIQSADYRCEYMRNKQNGNIEQNSNIPEPYRI